MRTTVRKIYAIPLLLLITACFMFAYSSYMLKRYRWVPATISIDLKPGVTELPEFQVDLSTKYIIELAAARSFPMEEINCLLGTPFGKSEDCKNVQSPVDLTWQLTTKGTLLASGSSSEKNGASLSSSDISRTIGQFNGEPGISYNLKVHSLNDASALAPTNPRIRVEVNPMEFKGHVVNSQLLGTLAFLMAIIGAVKLCVNIVSYYRNRESNET